MGLPRTSGSARIGDIRFIHLDEAATGTPPTPKGQAGPATAITAPPTNSLWTAGQGPQQKRRL